jgi:hypothetical protein
MDTGVCLLARWYQRWRQQRVSTIYPSLEAKVAAVEALLDQLDADPERVKRLTGWHWIADALGHLPEDHAA